MKHIEELLKSLKEKDFSSLEELNEALQAASDQYNASPQEDFCGLSPVQMNALLYRPFKCPDLVDFNLAASIPSDAPFINLMLILLRQFRGRDSLKATVTGNLPRKVCQDVYEEYLNSNYLISDVDHLHHPVMSEKSFMSLHLVRVVTELAGYIKKRGKKFTITEAGARLAENGISAEDYLHLLETYTTRFNWQYMDRYPPLQIIQMSFLFTLYLLKLLGKEWRTAQFYTKKFIRAYPVVLEELVPLPYETQEMELVHVYTHRALRMFAYAWGFAEIRPQKAARRHEMTIRKAPFLDSFIKFSIPR